MPPDPHPVCTSREPPKTFHLPMSKCLWPEVPIPSVPEEETSGQVNPPGAKWVLSPAGGRPAPDQELARYRNGGLSEPRSPHLRRGV